MDEPVITPTEVRRWSRRSTDRWFAGVASGVADGLDVDPWVVRLGFVVATVIGGVGVLAYAFLWWLLPRRDLADSAARRMSKRFPGAPTWLGVALLVVGVMLFAGQLGWWRPSLVFAFLLIGLGVLLFRGQTSEVVGPSAPPDDDRPSLRDTEPFPMPPVTPVERSAAPSPPQSARERWFLGLVGGALALGLLAMVRLMERGSLQDIGGEIGLLILAAMLLVVGLVMRGRQPKERGRSFVFPLTIGVALLALGIAALLDLIGAISLTVGGGFALVLLVLGVGLCVGAWYGQARWLLLPALLLAPLALLATVITIPLDQGFGDRSFAVTRTDQLPASYAVAGGTLRVDLTNLPQGTDPAAITAEMGAGKLQILVPSGADLSVTGDVGVGGYSVATIRRRKYFWVDVSRRTRGGVDMTIDESIEGRGGGRPIMLSVHTSVGEIEIDRVVTGP
ncbi:MAG: PspC domain-containing protein [Actinobacteria bacterium]|nr:MAG: PspC domain-containing protein [Actinomycetota bacterium]